MTTAIAIYLTGAVAWFGGMSMTTEMEATTKQDKNPFNNQTCLSQVMLFTAAIWPVLTCVAILAAIGNWATSTTAWWQR